MLSAYQKAYTKALGNYGILISHENSAMHQHAAKQADLFKQTFTNPSRRVDSQLLKQKNQQEKNKQDFVNKDINRGNFIAVLQLLIGKRRRHPS